METKLSFASAKLERREKLLKAKVAETKADGIDALKRGDEKAFRRLSKRYAMLTSQTSVVAGMLEMERSLRDLVEMQSIQKEVISIGLMLKDYQEQLGIDPKQMEQAISGIRLSVEKVKTATEVLAATMDTTDVFSADLSDAQEAFRAELMKEIECNSERTSQPVRTAQREKKKGVSKD